jgi:hypothetical protein
VPFGVFTGSKLERCDGDSAVDQATSEAVDAQRNPGNVRTVASQIQSGFDESPHGVSEQSDPNGHDREVSEGLVLDMADGFFLPCQFALIPKHDLQRKHADDCVNNPFHGVANLREPM